MSVQKGVTWSMCYVSGTVTTCDPGCNREYSYPAEYRREEIAVGDNLAWHNKNLPVVKVVEIGEDYLVVRFSGENHTLYTGGRVETPRHPLDYAYSEVLVRLE